MNYAEVAVNSPVAQRRTFCYSILPELNIDIGQAVWVPFGSKVLQGIVVKLSDYPSFEATKEINSLITSVPLLSSVQIEIALWLSKHYLAPLFDCVALMLPPGFERRLVTFLKLLPVPDDVQLSHEQKQFIHLLENRDEVRIGEVERELGKKRAEQLVQQLLRRGMVAKSQRLEEPKIKPKTASHLGLLLDRSEVEREILRLKAARSNREAAVLELLLKGRESQDHLRLDVDMRRDRNQPAHLLRQAGRQVQGNRASIAVTHQAELLQRELLDQRTKIFLVVFKIRHRKGRAGIGSPIPPAVICQHPETRRGQSRDLGPPGAHRAQAVVEQHNCRSIIGSADLVIQVMSANRG